MIWLIAAEAVLIAAEACVIFAGWRWYRAYKRSVEDAAAVNAKAFDKLRKEVANLMSYDGTEQTDIE